MKVIACATVIEELVHFLPADVQYQRLDFGLHIHPEQLQRILQEKIDQIKEEDTILLGYGLCARGAVGLSSPCCHLVIPRVDDCIAIFLGSRGEYLRQFRREPGTFYLTKGWIEAGDTPYSQYQRLLERYGQERALEMARLALNNYTRLALINTGNYDVDRYRDYARQTARLFELRYEEIEGSTALIRKMAQGPWDEEFVVVPPGEVTRYEMFLGF